MATINQFEDLEIWKKARIICNIKFEIAENSELKRDFKLYNQINVSSGSTMDNIAEGFERNGNKEFYQFLSIAKASCAETRSQLYRVFDRNYVTEKEFDKLKDQLLELNRMIGGFMNYLKKSDFKGSKYSN